MAESFLKERPLTVRMNLSLASREEIADSLEAGCEVRESGFAEDVVFLSQVDYLESLDAFLDGWIQYRI